MNELELMAGLRAEIPLEPARDVEHSVLTAIRQAGTKASPHRTARTPVRRFRRFLVSSVAVAVAAGVVAAVTVYRSAQKPEIAWSGNPTAPWAVGAPSYGRAHSEAQLLDFATQAAAAVPGHAPRPDQWIALKTETATSSAGEGGYLFGPPNERVIGLQWRKVDGTAVAAGINAPATMPATHTISTKLMISPDGMGNGTLSGWLSIKYNYLDSLPTNPQALKQVILAQDNPSYEPNQDVAVFDAIDTLFYGETEGALIPPRLAAALYGVLHLLPEVHFDTGTDLAGRTGLGFYMILDGYDKREIVINPVTYAYMGAKSVAIKDHTLTGTDGTRYIRAGQVLGWNALLSLAIVDKPGQLPS
ncbi:MAG TPA: CU044_5270 family protein [Trebonia sp.]